MKLFWYESSSRTSEERFLIRAATLERAKELANAYAYTDSPEALGDDWSEVTADGPEGVLYSCSRSYDTGE